MHTWEEPLQRNIIRDSYKLKIECWNGLWFESNLKTMSYALIFDTKISFRDPGLTKRVHSKCINRKIVEDMFSNMDKWEVHLYVIISSHCEFLKSIVYVGFHFNTLGGKKNTLHSFVQGSKNIINFLKGNFTFDRQRRLQHLTR